MLVLLVMAVMAVFVMAVFVMTMLVLVVFLRAAGIPPGFRVSFAAPGATAPLGVEIVVVILPRHMCVNLQ